ncbi:hypothetical protein M1523_01620 [Patescibacteria group bacterium]|nr:hypothetical protein [Patescibacteria group bacterium]
MFKRLIKDGPALKPTRTLLFHTYLLPPSFSLKKAGNTGFMFVRQWADQRKLCDHKDTEHASLNACYSILALVLITGAAETNIVVRIASSPIQVERKGSCVGRVIPIPTAKEHVFVSPYS